MAGSDPWARVVWVVHLGATEGSPLDSAWETFEAASLRARAIGAVRVARVPLEPPSGDVIEPEIELWRAGGRGKRPGLAPEATLPLAIIDRLVYGAAPPLRVVDEPPGDDAA